MNKSIGWKVECWNVGFRISGARLSRAVSKTFEIRCFHRFDQTRISQITRIIPVVINMFRYNNVYHKNIFFNAVKLFINMTIAINGQTQGLPLHLAPYYILLIAYWGSLRICSSVALTSGVISLVSLGFVKSYGSRRQVVCRQQAAISVPSFW